MGVMLDLIQPNKIVIVGQRAKGMHTIRGYNFELLWFYFCMEIHVPK